MTSLIHLCNCPSSPCGGEGCTNSSASRTFPIKRTCEETVWMAAVRGASLGSRWVISSAFGGFLRVGKSPKPQKPPPKTLAAHEGGSSVPCFQEEGGKKKGKIGKKKRAIRASGAEGMLTTVHPPRCGHPAGFISLASQTSLHWECVSARMEAKWWSVCLCVHARALVCARVLSRGFMGATEEFVLAVQKTWRFFLALYMWGQHF